MIYNTIIEGSFLERPNRFIAKVIINGKEEVAHVKNTGRCKELLMPGAKVILEDCSHNKNRKTKYSLIAVWKGDMLVNMDSQVPNLAVFEGLGGGSIKEFQNLTKLKREVTFGASRFDIYYEKGDKKGFIEVKGVTLENDGVAMFPDAPTERGTKHVLEMVEAVRQGYAGTILFLIQMTGPEVFKANKEMDKNFAKALKFARDNDVQILAYDAIVKENGICINRPLKIIDSSDELF